MTEALFAFIAVDVELALFFQCQEILSVLVYLWTTIISAACRRLGLSLDDDASLYNSRQAVAFTFGCPHAWERFTVSQQHYTSKMHAQHLPIVDLRQNQTIAECIALLAQSKVQQHQ